MHNQTNKRIAKNTIYLYIRMLVTMLVTLYTSRVVLNILGVENFGIYNIIGGIVVLFSFMQNAMSNATQRFLSFELGLGDMEKVKRTFCVSMDAHISIALLTFVLLETIGLWFVNNKLNIPPERMVAAKWVYQISILTFITNIIRVPYNASIIAYEKMSFFAYISIIEVVLKLLVVYLLFLTGRDKLITYSFLMFIVPLLCTIIYKIYCTLKFKTCNYHYYGDKKLYTKLMSFSGWSMFGGVANIGAQQGGNILLNIFSGVTANAAFGIANQVSNAIYGFVSNFQIAFNPQIVKLYATNDKENLYNLILRTSLFSYYLLLIIAIPFLINTKIILQLWLNNVPNYSVEFCQLMVVVFLIDSLQAPLWNAIYATGDIKNYQIWASVLVLLNVPFSYFLLKIGFSPFCVLYVRLSLNFILAILRTIYVKYFMDFPSLKYFIFVVIKALIVTVVIISIYLLYTKIFSNKNFVMETILSCLITLICIYTIGINKHERGFINSYLKKAWVN